MFAKSTRFGWMLSSRASPIGRCCYGSGWMQAHRGWSNATATPTRTILMTSHYTPKYSWWQLVATGGVAGVVVFIGSQSQQPHQYTTLLESAGGRRRLPASGDIINTGTPVKEPATGILFPQLCNGYYLAGCGVRIKYMFVKVYAVGTYMDPLAMSAVKKGSVKDIEQALLDPTYPRTIRIVMNRGLSIDKYTEAIVEALKPRMKGQDLDKLEEFKKLNPSVDLVQGAEIEMTIRGDTMLYKNAVGGVGTIRSEVFTQVMCDTYYGSDPVSPTHKESVVEGIKKL